ncbi:MAG TPA: glycosyltransferase [Gemmataceae bacterium]|nr:glycosyltransferase [Gemmataceae bacterium]
MPEIASEANLADKPLIILIPVFNDWPALGQLLQLLDEVLTKHSRQANVLIVDDGSTVTAGSDGAPERAFQALRRVDVLQLRRNLGHQRAIAVGLAYIADKVPCRAVIVMDSDGEDDPHDVPRLLKKFSEEGERKIIFAERTQRSETRVFRIFYSLYRAFHYLLTNQKVRVGNFSIIPESRLASLVVVSEIWNHYAAAVSDDCLVVAW